MSSTKNVAGWADADIAALLALDLPPRGKGCGRTS
jgi:hypothetical protein